MTDFPSELARLQHEYGLQPLATLPPLHSLQVIPTGAPALDQALHIGGVPAGYATTLVGGYTCGITPLTYQLMANSQQDGAGCAYVDMEAVFAPDVAMTYGLDLDRLLLIQPHDVTQALDIVHDLAACGDVPLVVLNWTDQPARLPLHRLTALLARSHCALVIQTNNPAWGSSSEALRLQFQVVAWVYRFGDVVGYKTQARVLKNKFGPVPEPVLLDMAVRGL